jgi:translation initiation factor 3 subunit G
MKRWGDDVDDSDDEQQPSGSGGVGGGDNVDIPPTHKSKVDSKGIQIVTSYRAHPSHAGQLIKTVTKIRVAYVTTREHVNVAVRRKWKKFGQAALDEDQSNVTIQSREDVYLEDPNADTDLQDEDPAKAFAGNLNAFWAKQQRRQLERKYDVDDDGEGGAADGAAAKQQDQAGGWTQVGASGSAPGKYVPPAQRAGGSAMMKGATGLATQQRTDDLNTIRVTNISENTTEADLQDLFQPFGRISRVYLAKDKETMVSRGFAFVSFVHKDDAAKAMDKLQGFGYDHLILKLEWARPNAPKDPSAATEYRSGYGKALAQDTKEKVSFASNLTK